MEKDEKQYKPTAHAVEVLACRVAIEAGRLSGSPELLLGNLDTYGTIIGYRPCAYLVKNAMNKPGWEHAHPVFWAPGELVWAMQSENCPVEAREYIANMFKDSEIDPATIQAAPAPAKVNFKRLAEAIDQLHIFQGLNGLA